MASRHTINISVLADTKKFSNAMRSLSRETGLSRLGDAFRNAGSRIVGFFRDGIKYAGLFGTAVAGLSLRGGLKRALAVEDATLLMQQLGMATEDVESAIAAVDRTFDGTPFANPDGFNFSAQLATSGRALDDIEADLRNVSNVTAMTLDKDFGRISEMFLKMSANGRVTAQDLNSISLAGYPIRQVLGEALGTTVEDLNAMVSAGDLSYDMLQELLGGVENLDGAAQNLGDSTRVSWSNMLTAFSVVGEKFLTDLLPTFREGFQDIRAWVRELAGPAAELGSTIATWLQDKAIPAVKNLGRWISTDLWPALKQVWELVSGAFSEAWATISAALADAGISAQGTGKSLKDGIISALEALGPILASIITGIADLVSWLIRNRDIIIPLVAGISAMVAAFMAAQKVLVIVKAAMAVLNVVMAANPIGIIILAIVGLVAAFVTLWNRSDAFREFWLTLWEAVKSAASAVVNWFKSIPQWFRDQFDKISAAVTFFFDVWRFAWDMAKKLVSAAWTAIRSAVQGGINRVRSILNAIGNFISAFLRNPIATVRNLFSGLSNTMGNIATQIWNRVSSAFSSGINRAVQWVRDIPSRIRSAIGNPVAILGRIGGQIIDGFINGIRNGFQRVRNTLGNLTSMLPSWKGPAAKDRKLLTGPADLIMDGLVDQFQRRFGDVRGVLGDLTHMIGRTDLGDLEAPGLARPGTYADRHATLSRPAAAGGRTYQITVQTLVPTPDTGRVIVNAIKDYERISGARAGAPA